ncbi:MAG TPA: hypothetical protein VFH61_01745 [Thermoleophilia bacterium]|nr:hypothetical protein [Thermoleophilia bacterium]
MAKKNAGKLSKFGGYTTHEIKWTVTYTAKIDVPRGESITSWLDHEMLGNLVETGGGSLVEPDEEVVELIEIDGEDVRDVVTRLGEIEPGAIEEALLLATPTNTLPCALDRSLI